MRVYIENFIIKTGLVEESDIETLKDKSVTELFSIISEEKGIMSTSSIVALLVSAVFVSALLPTIITSLTNMNTTGWGTTETTLVALLPLFVVIGIIGKFSENP